MHKERQGEDQEKKKEEKALPLHKEGAGSSSIPGRSKAAEVMRRPPDGPAQQACLHHAGMSFLSLSNPPMEDAAG